MNFLLIPWEFFVNNILKQPQFFIGLMVLAGYLLMKKPWYEALSGFIKASVGYLILSESAKGMIGTFRPILFGLKERFNLSAAVMDPYWGQTAVEQGLDRLGKSFSSVMILLLIAFILNLLLVRFQKITKLRAVFTTGHIQVQQAATAFWLFFFCFPQAGEGQMLLMMSIALGLYWAVGSNMTIAPSQRLTDGAGYCVAHQQMFGIAVFSWLAKVCFGGKRGESTRKIEDIKLPGFMSIFNENMVATTLIMTLFFGVIITALGSEYLLAKKLMGEKDNFFFYIINTAMKFSVWLAVLQLGVKTFVAELTESFQGISNRWLPGAVPGVDCAAVYGFGSQNAITIGFVMGAIGQFIGLAVLLALGSPVVVIAGFIPMFFDNATIALYANRHGGYKAAFVLPLLSGICQIFGTAFIVHWAVIAYNGMQVGLETGYLGMWDWAVLWPGFTWLMHHFAYVGFGVVVLILILLPQIEYYRNPKGYFLMVEDYEEYKRQFPEK